MIRGKINTICYFINISLICLMLMICCGCSSKNTAEENDSEKNSSEGNSLEEIDVTENELHLEDYIIDETKTTYSLSDLMPKDENIIFAGLYDENTILLLNEEVQSNQLVHTVETLSLDTGEIATQIENQNQLPEEHYGGAYGYFVINYNPFIIYDCNTCVLEIYNDKIDDVAYVSFGEGVNVGTAKYSIPDNSIYFLLDYNQKIYKMDLTSLDYSMEDSLVAPQMIDAEEKCKLIWEPDVNIGSCSLSGIDEKGNLINIKALDLVSDKWINLIYNLNTGEYEEVFANEYEIFYELQAADNSWTLTGIYDEEGIAIEGYEFCDYDKGGKYLFHPDLSVYQELDDDIYYALRFDIGGFGREGQLLSGVVDYNSGRYKDILLWDYSITEPEPAEDITDMETVALYQEIDYGALTDKADILEDKYGIQIIMGANMKNQFQDYTAEVVEDEEVINNALDVIDEALSMYPDGFLDELKKNWITSINIYLTGTLTAENSEFNISYASAVTSGYAGYQMIALDISDVGLCSTLIHEMSHVIDNKLGAMGVLTSLEEQWAECNPEGFEYYNNYIEYEGDFEYTALSDEFVNNPDFDIVYFCDDYSKTYSTEDRARIMEYFYLWENIPYYYNSQHIQEKLGIYLKFLNENFTSFQKDDSCLWNEMYEKLISEGI